MKYCGRVEVLLSTEVEVLEQEFHEAVLHLAKNDACNLAAYPISANSPLALLPEVQVCKRLTDNLQPFFETIICRRNELKVESGLILAFDDHDPSARKVIGFIDFIPSFCTKITDSTASVGSIVVGPSHRGRGVMKAMLAALQTRYSVLVLDCSVELVHIYKHLGYSPTGPTTGGTNVSMCNGVATGQVWEPPMGIKYKNLIDETLCSIREQMGDNEFNKAWRDLIADDVAQKLKVIEFFAKLTSTHILRYPVPN